MATSRFEPAGDPSAYRRWLLAEPIAPAVFWDVRRHAGFHAAIRAVAGGTLALSATDAKLAGVLKDAGRYVAAMCAASMQEEGVTLPRLKALCERFGLLSIGRARALLLYLRYLGYVGLWRAQEGNGPARYVPSPSFLDGWRAHLKVALVAAAPIDGFAATTAARLDEPAFFAAFCRQQMEGLLAAVAQAETDTPLFRVFFNRHAGPHIAYLLMLQGEGECPPRGPLRLSIADASRRLAVSTIHIRRLLHDGEKEGMLARDTDGDLRFTDAGADAFSESYAMQIARLLIASARTWDEIPVD